MARPSKEYCDYFPHSNNMRNHRKIRALRNKFKEKGYSIWNMLLEYLTGTKGHFFQNTDIEYELLAGDFEVSVTEIRQIVDYCIELQLLFIENGQIYSKSLLDELQPVYDKRTARKEFSEQQPREHGRFRSRNAVSQDLSGVSSTEMPQLDQIRSDQINTGNTNVLPPGGVEEKNKDEIVGVVEGNKISGIASKSKSSPKKKVAPKKKGKNPDSEPFMKIHRTTWLKFNQTHRRITPDMDDQDYHWLKEIAAVLRERAIGNAVMWTQENATARLEKFFSTAYCKSKWLKDHFRLANLYQQRNDIFQIIENPNGQSGNKVSAGASSTHGRTIEFDRP